MCTRQRGVTLTYTRQQRVTLVSTRRPRATLVSTRRPRATLTCTGRRGATLAYARRPRVTLTSGGRCATWRYAFQASLQHAFRPIHAAHRIVASLKGCPRGGYVVLLALQARFRPRVTLA